VGAWLKMDDRIWIIPFQYTQLFDIPEYDPYRAIFFPFPVIENLFL
jgi:hypothetical protein